MSSPTRRRPPTAQVAVALLTVYIVWGSTYLAIAIMIESMPPLLSAGVRFLIAGLILMVVVHLHARITRGGPGRATDPRPLGHGRSSSAASCCSAATVAWCSPS